MLLTKTKSISNISSPWFNIFFIVWFFLFYLIITFLPLWM